MPIKDLICKKCGYSCEELLGVNEAYPICPNCGERLEQNYNGKLYIGGKKEHCSGNCATCKGCK